jgi:hypothetical protein
MQTERVHTEHAQSCGYGHVFIEVCFVDIEEIFDVNWTFVVKDFECQEENFEVDSILF